LNILFVFHTARIVCTMRAFGWMTKYRIRVSTSRVRRTILRCVSAPGAVKATVKLTCQHALPRAEDGRPLVCRASVNGQSSENLTKTPKIRWPGVRVHPKYNGWRTRTPKNN